MERLTKRLQNGKALCIGVCEKECVEGHSECHKCKPFVDVIKKLAEYEDAEEQGLLLRLPCPIGTTVYCIEDECEDIYIEGSNYFFVGEEKFDTWMLEQFGKTVFLTEAEAEQALADMKKG